MPGIQAMSIEEQLDANIQPFLNANPTDPNANPLVDAYLTGVNAPRYDGRGRDIISYRQFRQLQERDADMRKYALDMHIAGRANSRVVLPASKYLKHWSQGYEIVGADVEETHLFSDLRRRFQLRGMEHEDACDAARKAIAQQRLGQAPRAPAIQVEAEELGDVTIYWCRDKYPDCNRFYDNERGLKFHWRNDHGEAPIGKHRPKAVVQTEDDDSSEE